MKYQVFRTAVGYLGVGWLDGVVDQLILGEATRRATLRRLAIKEVQLEDETAAMENLADRLVKYALGSEVDFSTTEINLAGRTEFQQAVLHCCQDIPWGQSLSYGELAQLAGYPRAARAVGGVMRTNRIPLIVP